MKYIALLIVLIITASSDSWADQRPASTVFQVMRLDNATLGKEIRFNKQFTLRKLLVERELSLSRGDSAQWFFDDFKNWLTEHVDIAANARDTYRTLLSHSSSSTPQTRSGRQRALSRLEDKYAYLSDALSVLNNADNNPVEKIGAGVSHRYLYQAQLDAEIAKLKDELTKMENLTDADIGQQYKNEIEQTIKQVKPSGHN
jgi:hypothetical protein